MRSQKAKEPSGKLRCCVCVCVCVCVHSGRKCVKEHVGSTLLTLVNHFHSPLIQLTLLENMWIIWSPTIIFPFPVFSLGCIMESDSKPLTLKREINDKGALQVCIRDLIAFGLSGLLALPDVGPLCFAMWENVPVLEVESRACGSSLSHPCTVAMCVCVCV